LDHRIAIGVFALEATIGHGILVGLNQADSNWWSLSKSLSFFIYAKSGQLFSKTFGKYGIRSGGRVAQIHICHCEFRPLRIVMVGVWQSHYFS